MKPIISWPLAPLWLLLATAVVACTSAGERDGLDDEVGQAAAPPIRVRAVDGKAQIRELTGGQLTVWSQSPEIDIEIENDGPAVDSFDLVALNALATTEFSAASDERSLVTAEEIERTRPTERQLRFSLAAGETIVVSLASPVGAASRYRIAVMGDIQDALDSVDEVFRAISDVGDLEFVLSTGDVVETAKESEYDLFDAQLAFLEIPFYSTIGNHELKGDHEIWHDRYGLYSLYFEYRGVAFSFIDSGNGSVHPDTLADLDAALQTHADRLHLVGTHYPPYDPIGVRSGSFRSRKEAAGFLARLAEGRVDTTFYGHIHSYYAFENAGIPAFISGGGGAFPERWDGIGRHFLVVTVDGDRQSVEVGLVRVD